MADGMDRVVLATQKVILDLAREKGVDIATLSAKTGGDATTWDTTPSLTYAQFLKSCVVLDSKAPELFSMTKDALVGARRAKATGSAAIPKSSIGQGEVDSAGSKIPSSGDVLMRWSSIVEAIAKDTGKSVDAIRGLFTAAPSVVDDHTIIVHAVSHGASTNKVITGLLTRAMDEIGIVERESLEIRFEDS